MRPRNAATPARLRAAERRRRVFAFRDLDNPRGFVAFLKAHLEHLKVKGYSERTFRSAEWSLSDFIVWCQERDVMAPRDVTIHALDADPHRERRKLLLDTSTHCV